MEAWQAIPLALLVVALLAVWLTAAYSMIRMLGHARGNWFALAFKPGWWRASRIEDPIAPDGIPRYRRLVTCVLVFIAGILLVMVLGAVMAFLESR